MHTGNQRLRQEAGVVAEHAAGECEGEWSAFDSYLAGGGESVVAERLAVLLDDEAGSGVACVGKVEQDGSEAADLPVGWAAANTCGEEVEYAFDCVLPEVVEDGGGENGGRVHA